MATETKTHEKNVGGVSAETPRSAAGKPGSKRKIGGVSPRAAHWMKSATPAGPVPASPAHPDFVWNGGPVLTCPLVYATFWGNSWTTNPSSLSEAGRLTQFLKDLVASQFMNVLSQYGAGSGAGAGLFMQASFVSNVPSTLTDAGIHTVIQNAINSGAIPEPPANNTTNCIMIFLDESIAVQDPTLGITMCEPTGDNAFGYHFFFTTAKGNSCYYSVIPALDDACITNSCGGGGGCSLQLSQTQEQRRTQVASHEFAEMATDPAFPTGWFGPASDENGDICNGEADSITVGPNTWDVQRTYSKADDIATNGASFCRATAPSPIPKLSPGPSGVSAAMTSAQHFGHYKPFLPLPTTHHDAKTGKTTHDDKEIERFARKFFYPLHHDHVMGDFANTLRKFADVLEKGKKK